MSGVDEAWVSAARTYRGMADAERASYWSRLAPEQQQMLQSALMQINGAQQPSSKPAKGAGCMRLSFIGCGGVVLGAVLVVAVEIMMIATGASMVRNALSPSGRPRPDDHPFETFMSNHPIISDPDPMPEYCKDGMLGANADERFSCVQWAERHSKGGSWGE
jgi:hypothetical protein